MSSKGGAKQSRGVQNCPQQGAPKANVTPLHSNSPTYKEVAVLQLSTETSIVLAVGPLRKLCPNLQMIL